MQSFQQFITEAVDLHQVASSNGYKKVGDTHYEKDGGAPVQDFSSHAVSSMGGGRSISTDHFAHNGHKLTITNHPRFGTSWKHTKADGTTSSGREHKKLGRTLKEQFVVENKGSEIEGIAAEHGFSHAHTQMETPGHKVVTMKHPSGHQLKINHFHQDPKAINHHYAGTDSTWSLHKGAAAASAMGHEHSHLKHVLGKVKSENKNQATT